MPRSECQWENAKLLFIPHPIFSAERNYLSTFPTDTALRHAECPSPNLTPRSSGPKAVTAATAIATMPAVMASAKP